MPMRTIRTMIATTWCGCERIMAGAGGVYLFAADSATLAARDGSENKVGNDGGGRGTGSKGLR